MVSQQRPQVDPAVHKAAGASAYHYQVYGVHVDSNVELPGFPQAEHGGSDVKIKWPEIPGRLSGLDDAEAFYGSHYHPVDGGEKPFAIFKTSGAYVLRWEGLCDFEVAEDGSQIICHPWPGVPWGEVNPFILGRLLPLALNFKGAVTLHGGAVVVQGGVAALLGTSGTGKSTLSASFHSLGHTLVSDDLVAVWQKDDVPMVEWGARHVRLNEKSLEFIRGRLDGKIVAEPDYDKTRLTLRDGRGDATGAIPLRTIYLLERVNPSELQSPEIVELPAVTVLPEIMQGISNRSILEKPRLAEQFELITRMLRHVPVKRLRYPSDMERLPEVCEAVNADH